MSQKQYATLNDFSRGMNNKDAANLLQDNALVDAQNAILGRGHVSKRYGYSRYTPIGLTKPITTLYDYHRNNGDSMMLAVSNKRLYKDNAGALTAVAYDPSPFTLVSDDVRMITYKNRSIEDVVLVADGGRLKQFNGSTFKVVDLHTPTDNSGSGGGNELADPGLNDLYNLSNFRTMALKKDRIFAAAHPTVKNRVSFCYHDPFLGYAVYDYWPATHFIDIAPEENDEIVELKTFRDALLIFCKRSIWILYGDGMTLADYELHRVNVPTGCISPKSVQMIGNEIFYMSEDHIYSLYATQENYISAKIVSEPIEETIQKYSYLDRQKAVGHTHENKYYLSFPDGSCLVYDALLGSWVRWTNVKANSFLTKDGDLYFSTDKGLIQRFRKNIYNDDGAPIDFSIKTKILDFKYPVNYKKFRKLWLIVKQYDGYKTSYAIQTFVDFFQLVDSGIIETPVNQGATWDDSLWDDATWDFAELLQTEVKIGQKGRNIQFMISNNNLNEPFTLFGITTEYKIKKP